MAWAAYAEICLGMMLMRPKDFWDMSLQEMYRATSGFKSFHTSVSNEAPLQKDELEKLMELNPD